MQRTAAVREARNTAPQWLETAMRPVEEALLFDWRAFLKAHGLEILLAVLQLMGVQINLPVQGAESDEQCDHCACAGEVLEGCIAATKLAAQHYACCCCEEYS